MDDLIAIIRKVMFSARTRIRAGAAFCLRVRDQPPLLLTLSGRPSAGSASC